MKKLLAALMFLWGAFGFGQTTWTHVQGGSAANSSQVTSLTLTLPSNPGAGHDVLVAVEFDCCASVPVSNVSMHDSNGNWYTISPHSPYQSPNNTASSYFFYLLNAPSNASQTLYITWTTAIDAVAWADEFSSSSGAATFDTDIMATDTFAANSINFPSITPAGSDELLYALVFPGNAITAPTAGANAGPWVGAAGGIDGTATGGAAEYDLSASATTAPNFTDAVTGDSATVPVLAISPASGISTPAPSTCGELSQVGTDSGNALIGWGTACVTGSNAGGYAASSISYWVGSPTTSTSFDLGVYSDSSGNPGALLCHASTGTITPSVGWNSINISGCPTLSASTKYWVGYVNGSDQIRQGTVDGVCPGTSNTSVYSNSSLPGVSLANPFGTIVTASSCYSIFMTLNTVSLPTPTLTVSGSPAPSNYGQSATFTATISNGVTGSITFYVDGSAVGTGAISGTTATFTTSALTPGTHSVTAGWSGNSSYNSVTSQATPQTVNLVALTITWAAPSPIANGVALSSTQLNATANIPGTFSYSPAAGTVLPPGVTTLSTTFTPTDTVDYATATATVPITVSIVPSPGLITTVAGDGFYGDSGDGGPAILAKLSDPTGAAVDSAGNLYFGDPGNSVIREVNAATGTVTTIAGNGTGGYSGDGGQAINAELLSPMGIALDGAGNIYFADNGNAVVRKINASTKVITTVAGDGSWGYSGDGGPATSATLSYDTNIAVDSAGNIYIADKYNMRVRKVSAATGIITTIAGNGTAGYTGDGSLATSAELNWPFGVAVDPVGNVYIADLYNNVIREVIASTGVIQTVVGNGMQGYSGDNGPASSAELNGPYDVALDAAGNLYISDSNNNVIRELAASSGTITTVAGNGTGGYSGDGGPATSAEINAPWDITTDAGGDIYIADSWNHVIRAVGSNITEPVKASPVISWADPAAISYGTALSEAQLNASTDVPGTFVYSPALGTVLPAGLHALSVLFTPNDTAHYTPVMATVPLTVSMVTPTIVWPTPASIVYGAALTATQLNATSNVPGTFAYSPAMGTVPTPGIQTLTATFTPTDTVDYTSVVATNTLIVSTMPGPGIITTVAGNGINGYTGDDGLAISAEVSTPGGVAFDASGNLYIASYSGNVIRKVDAAIGIITTVAGTGTAGYSGDGGSALNAELNGPCGLAIDAAGNIYIADTNNYRVRKVTASTGIIATVAGTGVFGYSGDGGAATSAEITLIQGLTVDAAGNLYLPDMDNMEVRKVSPAGIISRIAGTGTQGYSGDGGAATSAKLNQPIAVALDAAGDLFIADGGNNVIREVTASSGNISTFVGNGTAGYAGDNGPALSAELNLPLGGLVVDAANDLLIADSNNNVIRFVNASNGVITTVAGNGVAGYAGDGGPATSAELSGPTGVALDAQGNFYVADIYNNRVREVGGLLASSITMAVSPSSASLFAGQQKQFSATVTNTGNTAVTWSINPSNLGAISQSGLYTAPATITTQQSVTVTATSQANTAVSASATVTLMPTISVSVSPSSTSLYAGQSQSLSATVSNTSNTAVTWSISPTGVGSVDASGNYTAPSAIATQQAVMITATSQADTTKSASATIYLLPPCVSNGYSYVRSIVIDHTKVPNTDQSNFPFLFSTTDPAFKSVANGGHVTNPNGYDLVFSTDPSGATVLDFELEKYDPVQGQVVAWVRIPDLSQAKDTVLYLFYGNASISASLANPSGVWSNGYSGVWHLISGNSSTSADSTNNQNGTNVDTTSAIGPIAGAATGFDGATSYVNVPGGGGLNGGSQGTISMWVRWTGSQQDNWAGNRGAIVGRQSDNVASNDVLSLDGVDPTTAKLRWSSTASSATMTGVTPVGNAWDYVVVTFGSDGQVLYLNGNREALNYTPITLLNSPGIPLTLGAWINGGHSFLGGSMEEAHVSTTARSADWIATEFNNQSSPSKFYSLTPESTVLVFPNTVGLYASQTQQFSAEALAPETCASPVIWSLAPGAPGSLSGDGLYSAPSSISAEQHVLVTATSQTDPTKTGAASVTLLTPVANATLTIAATTQPPYVTGTSEEFTATLKNRFGSPLPGATVTFNLTGANPATENGTTDGNGSAILTYAGTHSGNDTIQAVASVGGTQVTSNAVAATWLAPVQQISTSSVAGEFFIADGSGTFDVAPNATPAFTQTFPTINFNPPSGTVPGNTSNVGTGTRPFTDVTTDLNGNYTGTIIAQGNGYQAGVGPMSAFQAVFRGTFTVASAGNVVFDFFTDDGFILGIANGATRVTGANYNVPSSTPFAQFPVMGGFDAGNSASGNQVVVNFPSAGIYPFELDYTECCGGPLVLTMTQGATNPTGIAPTGSLTLSPSSLQPLPAGGQQSFDVLASDAAGNPVPNLGVGLIVGGVDTLELTGTTNSTGHATIVYQDVKPGTATAQAVAFLGGMVTYSNQVNVPWTLPPAPVLSSSSSGSLNISISAENTVVLPSTLEVTGTAMDNSLSQGDSITTTWGQVGGSGTVTFADPHQLSTTASFSQPGSYVLQFSASDVNGGTSAQITVNVEPTPGVNQGWIGSPVYGSQVSCIVPITVATGESLQSGVLAFYPANDPNSITILNTNTTGSGQIGTFDTTVLNNGTYWIALQATDTNGNSEYNLALVTVTGNCKPGRVTSTVTDLVVPAKGLAINIQRTYDTLNASTVGDFGYGWNLSTDVNLSVDPKGDVSFTLSGIRHTFYLTPTFNGFLPFYTPAFTPEPGFHGTLSGNGPGCSDLFDFILPDGSLWYCIDGGLYDPSAYIYTDPSGTQYLISANGNLQEIVDKNGNALTIGRNGITSSTGLSVPFVRDASGRITEITDPQGNHYQYSYDASGDLESVTYPSISQASTYTYDTHHRYLSGTDFRGNSLPTTAYYGSSDTDTNGLPLNGRLKSVTDALGETTSYAYDLSTNTTTITYPPDANGNAGTATMVYDTLGDLLISTDPLGHTTTNAYDANRNLLSTTDPLGHVTRYTYDANGNKTSTAYPATGTSTNTTSSTTYNQYSEPTQTTDELGATRTFNYDVNFNPQSVSDNLGTLASFAFNTDGTMQSGAVGYDIGSQPSKASQFIYDVNGNLASRTDALGRTTSYTYDSLGHKLTMTEPLPNTNTSASAATTTYTYDDFGNLTQTSAPLGRVTSSNYDGNGNKTSDTDARGNTTSYQYDALNRLVLTTYPDSTTSSKTYDFRGNVITETDQAGHVTKHVYDLAGRETSVTRAYGTSNATTTSTTYDNAGRKLTETDALGHITNYSYDAAGNLTGVSGVGGSFTYAYDNARNRVSTTDGNGHTTGYVYDARKRLVETDYPDGTKKTNAYDGPGNLISVTDQAEKVVEYTYDAANQLNTVVQDDSPNSPDNTTIVGYDADGNPIVLTDANVHTTASSFDLANELTGKTLPDGSRTETRSYDQAGNLLSVTHFNGVVTTYTYDTLNRLLSRATPGETTVGFTYTATGKRHSMTDASGTTTYSYDAMDRLTQRATPEGTLTYTYDSAGNLASMASNHANGVSVAYTYDTLNRLSTVVDNRLAGSNTTTYAYDEANNVANVTYPNNVQTTFTYDQLNRVTGLGSSLGNYSYQLGPTGNRTSATEPSGRAVTWSYDGVYRLTNEAITGAPSGKNGTVAYGLDPVGNRSSASSSIAGLAPVSGTFNADDELSSETYDQNGNVLTTGGKTFAYDAENHLVSMGSTVGLMYDGDGNRVAKSANGVPTYYLVDDLNPTGYPQVVEELSSAGAVERQYAYGLQRISEQQAISSTWTPSFYGYDGGGSVRALTNAAGAVTDTYDYDAFGNKINSAGTTPNNYLYRGEFFDSDLGLYYLRARWMNPLTGRFMSQDPLRGNLRIPITNHKYIYAGANPVTFIDPMGREEVEYAGLLSKSEVASKFFATIGCGAAIGFTAATAMLDYEGFRETLSEDPIGPLAGTIGCVALLAGPSGAAAMALDVVGGIACVDALKITVVDFNNYLTALGNPNTATAVPEFRYINDLTQAVVGCALTGYSTTFDVGGYFE
jgi:RHS repeat-associated protein